MSRLFFFVLSWLCVCTLYRQDDSEPQDVATTEGLPSSLVNQAVCAISGEYTDAVLDVALPGPEPLVISRVYTSFSKNKPWRFNHYDQVSVKDILYEDDASYLICLQQPSGAQLEYVFRKEKKSHKLKKLAFQLLCPKGLTNGASLLSGKTNIKNQTVHYYPDEERVVTKSGAGHRKVFKKLEKKKRGCLVCGQTVEEKVNGNQFRYEGKGAGIMPVSEIICENKETKQVYSRVKFDHKEIGHDNYLQTLATSDGRKLKYFFKHHHYKVKEKQKHAESSYYVDRFYLTHVNHPYAPAEKYTYKPKAVGQDLHLTEKSRDQERRFLHISYYHKGRNGVGGEVGTVEIKKEDDFRLDRVKKLSAPVGTDQTPLTTHRFDYHAKIRKHKIDGHKKVREGYTDVYDAYHHKTRFVYDKDHRLHSIIRYAGTQAKAYVPYTKECFVWNKDGCLIAKIFKDGSGQVHHARTFRYDASGNIVTSQLCGQLTGHPCAPLLVDDHGHLIENGYERETKTYTYSQDGLNLLLTETEATGKTIRYEYKENSDLLKAKFLSYEGQVRLREFYSYDQNHTLEKKILDDGINETDDDFSGVTERHYTLISPTTEAPFGLPQQVEESVHDFHTHQKVLLKRLTSTYSKEGHRLEQHVFDANDTLAYRLQWTYDLHGNLTSETNALGICSHKTYDKATDNLIEESSSDVRMVNAYDFSNRLIEQKEIHPDQTLVTSQRFDYLSNCTCTVDLYGHETHQLFDDFGRVIETHYPPVIKEGALVTPLVKKSYDHAGFPIASTNANGETTLIEVNIRGQPTKVTYPDGTCEHRRYSLDGQLVEKVAKNGTRTLYQRDPMGRVVQETIECPEGIKQTLHRYNAFHLLESIEKDGPHSLYTYDFAGRLKQRIKNEQKSEQFYDALGRLCESREYHGPESADYRATIKKYDLLNRLTEERLQTPDGCTLHASFYTYDSRGHRTFVQTGEQTLLTHYNTRGEPLAIVDACGHTTHFAYNLHFINPYGQRVLQKTQTDPLGYRTVETYDTANRRVETIAFNPFGEKIARQAFFYDLVGNQTKIEEEVIEKNQPPRTTTTLFAYQPRGQVVQIIEAAGEPQQKITRLRYNAYGQKEAFVKPDGQEIHYTYDGFERLKTLYASDHSIAYLYEYNALDQITKVTDQNSYQVTQRDYKQGELRKETLANGLSIDYTYDQTGRLRTLLFPDQTGVEYVYNAVDLKEVHRLMHGQRVCTHLDQVHSLSGQVLEAQLPGQNGQVHSRFDPLGRLIAIESNSFVQTIPSDGFDAAGNLLKIETQGIACTFTYDDFFHIQSEKGQFSHQYTFDSLSNRTEKNGEKADYNALNQLIKKGEQALVYDPNGNLTQNGTRTYKYDALNRLIQVTDQDTEINYTYDPFHRRLTKKSQGQEDHFLYQGQEEVGRWRNGSCQDIRILGKNSHSRTVLIEIQSVPYVPLHDRMGNIMCLNTLQGEKVEAYHYSTYGEKDILAPSGEKRSHSTIGNPWQYAGKRIEEETGLIAFGRRDYDPHLGRWITPDPLGFADGSNLYAYVHNNSLQYIDEYGLLAEFLGGTVGHLLEKGGASYYQSTYANYCTPIGYGEFRDIQPVFHVDIENKLEKQHFRNQSKDPLLLRTGTYSINDFIDPKTGQNYQFKAMPPNKRVLFTNGVFNTMKDFRASLLYLAEMTGYNIEGIFCPTFGTQIDGICYWNALTKYIAYEGTREIQKQIRAFDEVASPGATMLSLPHSRGAVYTRNALLDSSPAQRQRVQVCAIAPGAYIYPELCKDIVHYESTRDVVPLFDYAGRRRCQETIVTLQPHSNAPLFDHSFTSPTYAVDLKDKLKKYLEE